MKKFTMKSIFAFLATAMLAMMLVGCGGQARVTNGLLLSTPPSRRLNP
ncbi:hypothetical protein [Phascolarctobacterium succinatutens]